MVRQLCFLAELPDTMPKLKIIRHAYLCLFHLLDCLEAIDYDMEFKKEYC